MVNSTYQRRRRACLCIYCGGPPTSGKTSCVECLARRRARALAIKIDVLTHYGDDECHCVHCGEVRIGALTIDHIHGQGKQHRKSIGRHKDGFYLWLQKKGYPPGYRTLCSNCNVKAYRLSVRQKPKPAIRCRTGDCTALYRARIKIAFMQRLGGRCSCGEDDIDVLTAHHVNNDGTAHRRSVPNGKMVATPFTALA